MVTYSRPVLEAEYDGVIIFDCLPQEHRSTLKISDAVIQSLESISVAWRRFNCDTQEEVKANLAILASEAARGEKFVIHLISHGCDEGLTIQDRTLRWEDLRPLLQSINEAMEGSLIVNMSSCLGLHGIKIVDPDDERLPFFGVIGSDRLLDYRDAIDLGRLFYVRLHQGGDVDEIVRQVNQNSREGGLSCISSEGFRKIMRKTKEAEQ